ncbi:MAG TPA: ChaN family lipoprotein [Pyrinomonadaceae bacterium]|nr:ChaN family lipoprotein [Pyrinomonadaceae bacterium]
MKRFFPTRLLLAAAIALHACAPARAQTGTAAKTDEEFRVFDSAGKPSTLEEVVGAMGGADAVLVGEVHDDAVGHRVEAELLRLAYARFGAGAGGGRAPRAVAVSLEMFERDVQTVLDEYLAGLISERHFLLSSRPWGNYETDYRPLVEFARAHKLRVIAANAPARYVSRVARGGAESLRELPEASRAWLPPLPVAPASRELAANFRRVIGGGADNPAHGSDFLLDAQNLRDAAMAHALAEHLRRDGRALVIHFTGLFHTAGRLGVPEHLARFRPRARVLVVTISPRPALTDFDAAAVRNGSGDFVIITRAARAR